MDNLFLVLVLLSLVAIPVGLIKPSLLKLNSRLRSLILTVGATFIFFVLFIATTDVEKNVAKEDSKLESAEEVEGENKEEHDGKEEEPKENADVKDEKTEETKFEYTDLYEGEQTIEVNPGTVWSENSYFNTVYDALDEIKKALEKDDEITSVLIMINAELTDNKGNEEEKAVITFRYSRDTFGELNYDNFKEMSLGQEWRILNESDGYFIHKAIRSNLKSKYADNLR